ncbi:hypothetical protein B0H13DRAFT_2353753 [Mycena leptocephala]|nr:hypothetical protein B0H13DRAFT_2353753 [Mycena leptocephala]
MGPPRWTDADQTAFLFSHLPAYRKAVENKKKATLTRYWTVLEEEWFAKWCAEEAVGLPAPVAGSEPLTAAQLAALGEATQKTKNRLKSWMRYQARPPTETTTTSTSTRKSSRSLFKSLKASKSTRPVRPVEVYQKLYNTKVKDEVHKRGYAEMNEEARAARVAAAAAASGVDSPLILTAEESEAAELAADDRRAQDRSARMSLWRTTSIEMYAAESDEVKLEVEAATAKANEGRLRAEPTEDGAEKTPEEYQHGIDQIGAVFAKIHQMTMDETGWYGVTILGGPMPRRGGQISTKTICFGLTPHGNDFAASIPDFDGMFKAPVQKWLKRAFPHWVCDARALGAEANDTPAPVVPRDLDGLIPMERDPENPPTQQQRGKSTPRQRQAPTERAATSGTAIVATAFAPALTLAPLATPLSGSARPEDPFDFSSMAFNEDANGMDLWNGDGGVEAEADAQNPFAPTSNPIRPTPRPIHTGAAFAKDREVGGSPGRAPSQKTTEVNGFRFPILSTDYQPSVLFEAFTKTPSRTTSLASLTPSIFGASSSSFTSAPLTALDTNITNVAYATAAPSLPTSSPHSPTASTPASAATPVPAPTPPAGFTLPNTRPAPPSCVGTGASKAASSGAPPRPSALSVFIAAVANATPSPLTPAATPPSTSVPAATPAMTQATPTPLSVIPQYFLSRPLCNPPKESPLAPTAEKAAGEAGTTRKAPAKRGRGRPRGGGVARANPPPPPPEENNENEGPAPAKRGRGRPRGSGVARATNPPPSPPQEEEENSGAATATSISTESARIHREAAGLRRQTLAQLTISKKRQAEEEAEERRERARLHNPAGGVELVIIPRPKRFAKPNKNPDGSDIIRERKRTRAEISAAADAEMLTNLKKSISRDDGPAAKGKRKAAETADGAPANKYVFISSDLIKY